MKTLEVLLKRANRQMESLAGEANRAVADYNRALNARSMCEASLMTEAALIDGSPLSGMGYAAFLDRQKAQLKELSKEVVAAEEKHAKAKTTLMTAYAEVKKLEALLARQKQNEQWTADKAEQDAFDERSSQIYGR